MNSKLLVIGMLGILVASCGGDEDDNTVETATMCYEISGSYMTVNCYHDSTSVCEDDGKTSLGKYDDWRSCWDDTDTVTDYWAEHSRVQPGPGASSGGGGSGGGGGGSGDPDDVPLVNYTYTCPATGAVNHIDVIDGPCRSDQEYFARSFGCNHIEDFGDSCYAFYGCLESNYAAQNSPSALCAAY